MGTPSSSGTKTAVCATVRTAGATASKATTATSTPMKTAARRLVIRECVSGLAVSPFRHGGRKPEYGTSSETFRRRAILQDEVHKDARALGSVRELVRFVVSDAVPDRHPAMSLSPQV